MSEHQLKDNNKGRAQDMIGLVLCAFGGFGAVSVLMQFFGSETPKLGVLRLFTATEGLLGVFPAFMGLLGMAVLGCVMFLRSQTVDAGRHLLGMLGLVLGSAILFGGLHSTYGGAIGGSVTLALNGSLLGKFLSILLGFIVVGASAALSWGVWLKPLLAKFGEFTNRGRGAVVGSDGQRVAPSDRTEPDAEGVTAAEAQALVLDKTEAPHRSDPFEPVVRAKPEAAPATDTSSVAARAVASEASSAAAPDSDIQVSLPSSGAVEDISRALKKASLSQSSVVPNELRGPNPGDDVRLGGGVPEGARPLEGSGRSPLRQTEPEDLSGVANQEQPEQEFDPTRLMVDGEVTQGSQPAEADDLLAEIRAASERLKVLEEESSQITESSEPVESTRASDSYWARGESEAKAESPEEGTEAAGSTWEGNTWRPSWEAQPAESSAEEEIPATAGPSASWENQEPTQAEENIAVEEYEEEDEVYAEDDESAEDESAEDESAEDEGEEEEEYEDDEVYAEDEEGEDEEDYEEEEAEEDEYEDDEVYAEDEDEAEYDDEEEEEEEEYEDEDGEEELEEDEYEDEEVYAEEEQDGEDEEEPVEEEPEDLEVLAEDPEQESTQEPDSEPEVELIPIEADAAVEKEDVGAATAPPKKSKAKSPAKKRKSRSKAKQADLFETESADSPEQAQKTSGKSGQKATPRSTKKTTAAKGKKAPEPEPEVVLQPQAIPEASSVDPSGKSEPVAASKANADAPPATRPTEVPEDVVLEPAVWGAGSMFLDENRVAVSMLQRRYQMDFDEACQVLDKLQEIGMIGPYLGGKTRDILLGREEWEALARGVSQS